MRSFMLRWLWVHVRNRGGLPGSLMCHLPFQAVVAVPSVSTHGILFSANIDPNCIASAAHKAPAHPQEIPLWPGGSESPVTGPFSCSTLKRSGPIFRCWQLDSNGHHIELLLELSSLNRRIGATRAQTASALDTDTKTDSPRANINIISLTRWMTPGFT